MYSTKIKINIAITFPMEEFLYKFIYQFYTGIDINSNSKSFLDIVFNAIKYKERIPVPKVAEFL